MRPRAALTVAVALTSLVVMLRFTVTGAADAVLLLLALPIALVAVSFGRVPGLVAGLAGVAVLGGWAVGADVALTPLGWTARAVPMLLLGGLLGDATHRLHRAAEVSHHLDESRRRSREAAEINDSILQRLSVAKWMAEAGDHERALELLDDAIAVAQSLVADLLAEQPAPTAVRVPARPKVPTRV